MASLDCARRQIVLHGRELLEKTINLCNYTRNEINKIPGFYCFGEEVLGKPGSFAFDPTKLTISCRDLGISGYELDMILSEKYAIQMELSDFYNVLAVGSFGDTKEGMDRLLKALKEISDEYFGKAPTIQDFLDIPPIPKKVVNPREAFYADKLSVPLKDSLGKISGEFLLAYPPGIPLLCPGEEITKEIISYVEDLKRANLYVQGTEDSTVTNIKILENL
jgi:arginine/lysine/ornithine decarboxylase